MSATKKETVQGSSVSYPKLKSKPRAITNYDENVKGTFKVLVKSAALLVPSESALVQIIFGNNARRTRNSDQLVWNEEFTFSKTGENRLGVQIFSKDGKKLIGLQEIGINSFIKRLTTIDHTVELMNEGVIIGEIMLCFDYMPSISPTQQWHYVGTDKRKKVKLHKLHLSKFKAIIESDEANRLASSFISAPQLRVQIGKKIWLTGEAAKAERKSLSWLETFKAIIENEQELTLDLCLGFTEKAETSLGSAVVKLKQLPEGSFPNKIPILLEGKQIGFFYFQSDNQIPKDEVKKLQQNSIAAFPQIKPGRLTLGGIRAYLEYPNKASNAQILIQWGDQQVKTEVCPGEQVKPEWRDLLAFNSISYELSLEVKLIDSSTKSPDEPVGYGVLLLEPKFFEGGKFRSQKIEIHGEHQVGCVYIDYEYLLENQGVNELIRNDPLDMAKRGVVKRTEEDIRKADLLQKRRELMKPDESIVMDRRMLHLPQIDEASMFSSSRSPQPRSPQPRSAIKTVHSVSLPNVGIDFKINEYSRFYKDSMFGMGMSNVHSSASLRHSVPSFSLGKATRFHKIDYAGIDSLTMNPPSNFRSSPSEVYPMSKKKIFTHDSKYQIFHKTPQQKSGANFGSSIRFKLSKETRPGFYQGPQVFNYEE